MEPHRRRGLDRSLPDMTIERALVILILVVVVIYIVTRLLP
jgi:hypothetical protein